MSNEKVQTLSEVLDSFYHKTSMREHALKEKKILEERSSLVGKEVDYATIKGVSFVLDYLDDIENEELTKKDLDNILRLTIYHGEATDYKSVLFSGRNNKK